MKCGEGGLVVDQAALACHTHGSPSGLYNRPIQSADLRPTPIVLVFGERMLCGQILVYIHTPAALECQS